MPPHVCHSIRVVPFFSHILPASILYKCLTLLMKNEGKHTSHCEFDFWQIWPLKHLQGFACFILYEIFNTIWVPTGVHWVTSVPLFHRSDGKCIYWLHFSVIFSEESAWVPSPTVCCSAGLCGTSTSLYWSMLAKLRITRHCSSAAAGRVTMVILPSSRSYFFI